MSPFGDLGPVRGNVFAFHLYLVGKPVVDFIFVIIELLSLFLTTDKL